MCLVCIVIAVYVKQYKCFFAFLEGCLKNVFSFSRIVKMSGGAGCEAFYLVNRTKKDKSLFKLCTHYILQAYKNIL